MKAVSQNPFYGNSRFRTCLKVNLRGTITLDKPNSASILLMRSIDCLLNPGHTLAREGAFNSRKGTRFAQKRN